MQTTTGRYQRMSHAAKPRSEAGKHEAAIHSLNLIETVTNCNCENRHSAPHSTPRYHPPLL